MKIRSQLMLSAAIAVAVGVLAGSAVWLAAADANRADLQQERAQSVAREVAGLLVLTQEFSLSLEPRPAQQWRQRHALISSTLKSPSLTGSAPPELVESTDRLTEVFARLSGLASDPPGEFLQRRKQFLLDQLLTDIQVVLDGSHRWTRDAGIAKAKAQRQFLHVGVAASGALLLLLLGQAWLIARRVLRPIARLVEATHAIQKGQWPARIDSQARDELGDLARHFDNMSVALQQGNEELRRQQGALERSEASARLIVETAYDAYIAMDLSGRVIRWNPEAERLFGWTRAEVEGRQLDELIIPERFRAQHRHGLARLAQTGVATILGQRLELPAQAKDGREIQVELTISGLGEGDLRWFSCFLHDITERQQQQSRIENALLEKETLLREVYHRVKNNLQVIQSLLSLQRRSVPAGPVRTAIEDTVQRVSAMALVHEKLYQSGNLSAVSLPEYTHDLVKQIALASNADQRKISLHADIVDGAIGLDNAVPFGLLLTELIANALKHAFPEGRAGDVWVTLSHEEGGARLTVADNGVGFPDGFKPLEDGATMGLKLARSLAKQLGGELQVSNANGVVFQLALTRL